MRLTGWSMAGLAMLIGTAQAQDNLQLYGRFDAGLSYTTAVRGTQDGAAGSDVPWGLYTGINASF